MDGILNIYKERGFTSHDVVAKLRGILHQKKIGHTGTLDPEAVGVLPICLGKGTKLCDMLTDRSKTYQVEMRLGITTDTEDMTGTILTEQEVTATLEQVEQVISQFVGEIDQIPPMYSALKVNGKKLYELAREGIVIERKPRRIQIDEIKILAIELPIVKMEVSCSKGTYIRSLCRDIGEKLGCGGCMETLIRTRVGQFFVEDSLTLKEIEQLVQENKILEQVLGIETVFLEYPVIQMKKESDRLVLNGNFFGWDSIEQQESKHLKNTFVRVHESQGRFVGIYQFDTEKKRFMPEKMFLPLD